MERNILNAFRDGVTRILVDSPPGAGKTYLVESCAGSAVQEHRWSVGVATHTTNQRDDFAVRFHARFPRVPLQVLLASTESKPPALTASITAVSRIHDLAFGSGVIVSTTKRFFYLIRHRLGQRTFDLIITDEAYQIEYKDGLSLDALAPKRLMVGDPGQIAPFSQLDTEVFETARDHILWAMPKEMFEKEPGMARFAIDVSRRLPPDTVRIVQPAFYPRLSFTAGSTDQERRLVFQAAGVLGDRIDRALDAIGRGASIVAIQLPNVGYEMDVDAEMCDEAVEVVRRLRMRGATWQQHGHRLDIKSDVGYCDSHIDSVTAVQTRLRSAKLDVFFDDTPNRIQGRETQVTIVKHPLSSLQAADSFHLDPGRLCVMLSRHKLACVVLVRGDLDTLLQTYEHDCGERLAGREDVVWSGYLAHRRFWSHLTTSKRVFN